MGDLNGTFRMFSGRLGDHILFVNLIFPERFKIVTMSISFKGWGTFLVDLQRAFKMFLRRLVDQYYRTLPLGLYTTFRNVFKTFGGPS